MSGSIGKHIGDHIGDVIHHEGEREFGIRYATRTNTYAFFEAAVHHERPLSSNVTWTCQMTGMWIMGAIETARSGEVDIVLNDMFCGNSLNERYHITGMPMFTATPQSATPVLLTTEYVVQEAGTTPSTTLDGVSMDDILEGHVATRPPIGTVKVLDVRIRVHCWQLNGQPAPYVEFAWTCLAEGVITTKA